MIGIIHNQNFNLANRTFTEKYRKKLGSPGQKASFVAILCSILVILQVKVQV